MVGDYRPSVRSPPARCGRVVLPPLHLGVPAAFRKQAVDIGKRAVAADEEPEAFAIRLARPASVPRFATGIVRIEPGAPQRLPAAVWASLNVASVLVLLAERHATVGATIFHRVRLHRCVNARAPLLASMSSTCDRDDLALRAGVVEERDEAKAKALRGEAE
jgi:hypothetical protein